jgi:RNA polymerase sigma-70 factor (ECF subfamily)
MIVKNGFAALATGVDRHSPPLVLGATRSKPLPPPVGLSSLLSLYTESNARFTVMMNLDHRQTTSSARMVRPRTRTYPEAICTMPSAPPSSTFEQLALPLLPSLYSHAFWLTRDHAEAEDLAQETISKALRAFDSFQDGTNFKAWVFRILRNTFLTSRTGVAASRTVFLEDHPDMLDSVDASPTPEDNLIQLNNHAALYTALDQLQPALREALLLCDVEELKYKEIAAILELPIGTVMSRISRARLALRHLLQPQFGETA